MKQKSRNGEIPVIHTLNRLHSPTTAHKARRENGMKNCNTPENQTTRRILPIACATALAVAFTVSLGQPAHAQVTPP